jgi:hypothetical protein
MEWLQDAEDADWEIEDLFIDHEAAMVPHGYAYADALDTQRRAFEATPAGKAEADAYIEKGRLSRWLSLAETREAMKQINDRLHAEHGPAIAEHRAAMREIEETYERNEAAEEARLAQWIRDRRPECPWDRPEPPVAWTPESRWRLLGIWLRARPNVDVLDMMGITGAGTIDATMIARWAEGATPRRTALLAVALFLRRARKMSAHAEVMAEFARVLSGLPGVSASWEQLDDGRQSLRVKGNPGHLGGAHRDPWFQCRIEDAGVAVTWDQINIGGSPDGRYEEPRQLAERLADVGGNWIEVLAAMGQSEVAHAG